MRNTKLKKGFTLTELVVVIAIIAILILVVVPTFNNIVKNAEGSAALSQAKDLYGDYVRANSKEGKIDNDLYIQVDEGYVHYIDGKPVQNEDESYVVNVLYVNDDLLDNKGKYVESRFKDHESILKEFLKDYNIFSKEVGYNTYSKNIEDYWKSKLDDTSNKVSINKNDAVSTVSVYRGFWESSALSASNENYNKWSWMFEALSTLGKNQGIDTTDIDKMINNPNFDETNLDNVLQNIALFFLKANKATWDAEYLATNGPLLENLVIDCSSVTFEDYFKLIPREIFINSNYEYDPPIYVIEYNLSEGSFEDPESIVLNYQEGDIVDLPIPVRTGYDFIGWYEGENYVNDLTMPGNNITLEARWELATYSISYDLGGEDLDDYDEVIDNVISKFLTAYNPFTTQNAHTTPTTHSAYTFSNSPRSGENTKPAMFLLSSSYRDEWLWLVKCIATVANPGNSQQNRRAWEYLITAVNNKNTYNDYVKQKDFAINFPDCIHAELRGFVGKRLYGTITSSFQSADYSSSSVRTAIWNYIKNNKYYDGRSLLEVYGKNYTFKYEYNMNSDTYTLPQITNPRFLGWYLNDVEITSIPKGTTGDINLVAKWEAHNKTYLDSILLSYYSNTGNAAGSDSGNGKNYICDKVGIDPSNGFGNSLQWQNKILLRYDDSKKAYLVVAKNSATNHVSASSLASSAGVTWTHAICSVTNNIQDKVSVGQYIVIDPVQDFSSYYGIDKQGFSLINTYARIYDSSYGN